ncbi:hypothetical protein [Methylobacterium nigriterrae]|uniref:hypothetical protein n=1 Tax=Methylobacterium nigriterrae TaxID=3127512 RepID=UPI003013BF44
MSAGAQVVIAAICVTIGAQFGLSGVRLGWSAASACMVPVALLVLKACPIEWRVQLSSAVRIAWAGAGFVAAFFTVRHLMDGLGSPIWIGSLVGTGLGLALYTALIEFLLLPGYVTAALRSLRAMVTLRTTGSPLTSMSRSVA